MNECDTWKSKYNRLLDSYARLQRSHKHLESRLLRTVDNLDADRAAARHDISVLTSHLVASRAEISRLRSVNENLNRDLRLAVELLQCHPTAYVDRKVNSLPADMRNSLYVTQRHADTPLSPPAVNVGVSGERSVRVYLPSGGVSYSSSLSSLSSSVWSPSAANPVVGQHSISGDGRVMLTDGEDRVSPAVLACLLENRRQQLASTAPAPLMSTMALSADEQQQQQEISSYHAGRVLVDAAVQTSCAASSSHHHRRPLSMPFPCDTAGDELTSAGQQGRSVHFLPRPLSPVIVTTAAVVQQTSAAPVVTSSYLPRADVFGDVLGDVVDVSAVTRLFNDLPSTLLMDSVDVLPAETRV